MLPEREHVEQYEPPRIEDQTDIALPLIAGPAAGSTPSAVFRPVADVPYEPPRIEQRTDISLPLIGQQSGLCTFFTQP